MRNILLLGVLAAGSLLAFDPAVGTWKMNVEKSRLAKPEAWNGVVMTIELLEGESYRYKFTYPKGRTVEEVRIFDGKERPGNPPGTTRIYTRKDAYHHRNVQRKDGKDFFTLDAEISADGNTLSAVVKDSAHPEGVVEEVRVYEKQ